MSGIFPLQNQRNMTVGTTNQPNQMFVPAGPVPGPVPVEGLLQAMQQRQNEQDEAIEVSPIIRRQRTMRAGSVLQRPPQQIFTVRATGTTLTPPPPQIDSLTEMQLDRRDEAFVPSSPQYRRRLRGG